MRISRSAVRSVPNAMIASATANSGASAICASSYSPTQNDDTGIADNMPASWCRNLRKAPSSLLVGAERFEAVDHHQPGTPLLQEFADTSEHAGQAVLD